MPSLLPDVPLRSHRLGRGAEGWWDGVSPAGSHAEEERGLRPLSWAPHPGAQSPGGDCHQLSCCMRRNKVRGRKEWCALTKAKKHQRQHGSARRVTWRPRDSLWSLCGECVLGICCCTPNALSCRCVSWASSFRCRTRAEDCHPPDSGGESSLQHSRTRGTTRPSWGSQSCSPGRHSRLRASQAGRRQGRDIP